MAGDVLVEGKLLDAPFGIAADFVAFNGVRPFHCATSTDHDT